MPKDSRVPRSGRIVVVALTLLGGVALPAKRAAATTTLTVDLSTSLGPVTHAASGSLYGVTETLPADVTGLIGPLHPNVFVNPAADQQQPVGDAIVVAGRLAPVGGRVTIRLADWLKGFYTFTSMTDWISKVDQTVSRRQAAGLTNIYGYEIWNEPQGTYKSSNPLAFNDFWKQTYTELRRVDPTIKIIGPSIAVYSTSYLSSFLSYCKTNACLPDIVSWHELSGQNVTNDLQSYRSLEQQLGIGPLPISINEYSGGADLSVEGQPGASAPLIAKFERFRVDSACISFWDVAHPGRLGSLLASNTATNGGWWFYKWYGDMAGTMVSTTPPSPASPSALDGFANVDSDGRSASVLFGGTNDGSVQIVVKGLHAATFFGASVHAVVEHTPFVSRTTVVTATTTVSTADLTVSNDQLSISVPGTNGNDGYRVVLTPIGGGAGGAGSGGLSGSGGMSGSGGLSGAAGMGGGAGRGGATGSGGGVQGSGGITGSGGTQASGGTTGSGGTQSSGGATGSGGQSNAGSGGAVAASGGSSGEGGSGTTGTGGAAGADQTGDMAGCSCALGRTSSHGVAVWLVSFLVVALLRGRRRGGAAPRRT